MILHDIPYYNSMIKSKNQHKKIILKMIQKILILLKNYIRIPIMQVSL